MTLHLHTVADALRYTTQIHSIWARISSFGYGYHVPRMHILRQQTRVPLHQNCSLTLANATFLDYAVSASERAYALSQRCRWSVINSFRTVYQCMNWGCVMSHWISESDMAQSLATPFAYQWWFSDKLSLKNVAAFQQVRRLRNTLYPSSTWIRYRAVTSAPRTTSKLILFISLAWEHYISEKYIYT